MYLHLQEKHDKAMIKTLTLDDVPSMTLLHTQGFDRPWPEQDFMGHINNELDFALGVFGKGFLCGFILIRRQDDQAEILTLVVGERYRGGGHGKKLICAGENLANEQGAEIMFLDVAKDNAPALGLYKGTGYQNCGQRPGYYRRPHGRVDALLFQKHIAKK